MLEADFIESLEPRPHSVLDAGCGTGRLAIELAQRGFDAVGVDISPAMLAKARHAAPHLSWRLGDISCVRLERRFDAVVMAGNVMLFLRKGSESAVMKNMARHLAPGGRLIAGFFVGMSGPQPEDVDRWAGNAGLQPEARYAGWDREAWQWDSPYAVRNYVKDFRVLSG